MLAIGNTSEWFMEWRDALLTTWAQYRPRYSNHKVGGIRFMRVGRVFCSFGISK